MTSARRLDALQGGLLVAAIALVPFNVEIILWEYGGYSDVQHRVSIFLFDLPLVALALLTVWRPLPPIQEFGRVRVLVVVFLALVFVAYLVDPSTRGVQVLARLVVNVVVPAMVLQRISDVWVRRVIGALIVSAALQAALGVVQVATHDVIGLTFLGENGPLRAQELENPAKGTFVHPYMLAGFAAVACAVALRQYCATPARRWWLGAAVAAVPIGITYARMAVVAAFAMVVVVIVAGRHNKRILAGAAAVLLGAGIPALATLDDWAPKFERTTNVDAGADVLVNQRLRVTQQAWDMIEDSPLVGVGPGLYVIELEQRLGVGPDVEVKPVHLVPMLVAAEAGVPAGIVLTLILVWLGKRAWRQRPGALLVYVAYLPFLLLDHFPYDNLQGLTLTGFWIGLVLRPVGPDPSAGIAGSGVPVTTSAG